MSSFTQSPQPMAAPPSSDGLKVTAVSNEGLVSDNRRTKNGKFTMAQLRQTDGIVPLQYGTNQFSSQAGQTGFGTPRNTSTKVEFADEGKRWNIEGGKDSDGIVRLQSGTNRFASQAGMSFGSIRDVKGKHLKRIWELEFPEEATTADFPVKNQ